MGKFLANQNYKNQWYYSRCNGPSGVPFVNIDGGTGNIYANDQNMKTKPLRIDTTSPVSAVDNYKDIFKPSSQTEANFSVSNFTGNACGVISSGYSTTSQWQYSSADKSLMCTVVVNATSDITINSFALYEQVYTNSWVTGIIGLYYLDRPISLSNGESATVVIGFVA